MQIIVGLESYEDVGCDTKFVPVHLRSREVGSGEQGGVYMANYSNIVARDR